MPTTRSLAVAAVALAMAACAMQATPNATSPMPTYQARLATDIREAAEPKLLLEVVFLIR